MKRLFTVKEKGSNKLCRYKSGELITFSNKNEAKEFRDAKTKEENKQYVVALGPDHRRFTG